MRIAISIDSEHQIITNYYKLLPTNLPGLVEIRYRGTISHATLQPLHRLVASLPLRERFLILTRGLDHFRRSLLAPSRVPSVARELCNYCSAIVAKNATDG